ncbi:MAG: glycosyl hydrolase 108 family protein, partial [Steroidobacteraceae bacterium]
MSFDRAASFVLAREGGTLTDDPKDPGGLSRYGIALARHPELKADDIRAMTPERARAIYFSDYWMKVSGDQWPDAYSVSILDAAILQGPETAVRFAQAALYV